MSPAQPLSRLRTARCGDPSAGRTRALLTYTWIFSASSKAPAGLSLHDWEDAPLEGFCQISPLLRRAPELPTLPAAAGSSRPRPGSCSQWSSGSAAATATFSLRQFATCGTTKTYKLKEKDERNGVRKVGRVCPISQEGALRRVPRTEPAPLGPGPPLGSALRLRPGGRAAPLRARAPRAAALTAPLRAAPRRAAPPGKGRGDPGSRREGPESCGGADRVCLT